MAVQLECRIVLTYPRRGGKVSVGMYDPLSGRYEPLGDHEPHRLEAMVRGLAARIEREGHRLTWCERSA